MAVYKDKERGTWYSSFHYVDWTGKNCRKLKRGFTSKKEAIEWETHFVLEKASTMDMTFEDFTRVYEADVKPKLKENTWMTKEHVIRTKLIPYFGNKKMADINARDIVQWQNVMLGKNKKENDGESNDEVVGYAPTYLKTLQAQLSCIFNHAVRLYDLLNNPVRKAGAFGEENPEEMLFWTKEEYLQFIPAMADKTYSYLAFEILYWCGIRLGELRALTPTDFDFEKNTLSITKSYQKIKGRDVVTKPKTKNSVRTVYMPEMVAMEMKDFLDGIYGLNPEERIFQFSKSYLHHEMDRGVKATGVKRIRIHDLRHSHVSLLINMGFSVLAIGNRVGHESEKITYRYAHLFPSVQDEMVQALDIEWKEGFDYVDDAPKTKMDSKVKRKNFRLIS